MFSGVVLNYVLNFFYPIFGPRPGQLRAIQQDAGR